MGLVVQEPPASLGYATVAEVVELARRVAPPGDSLTLQRATFDGASVVVRFAQRHDGLEVMSRGVTVVSDASGLHVRHALARDLPPAEPRLSAAAAAALVQGARAELAYAVVGGVPRLVYRVAIDVPFMTPTRPVALVDAREGRVVQMFDVAVRAGQTLAYRENPIASPSLERLPFALLTEGATTLEHPLLGARSCVDRGSLRRAFGIDLHVCDLEATARADENGDFLLPPPSDPGAVDPFSETQVFFHAGNAARFFRDQLGVTEVPRLEIIASVRWPPGWLTGSRDELGCASCPLDPMANAFYAPADPTAASSTVFGVTSDAIFLGVGRTRSYAVDGDIVAHEYAHAVTEHTVGFARTPLLDEQGVSFAPAAANEAVADYFAAVLHGDPTIGEWASAETDGGEGSARTLEGEARCPDAIVGEPHRDSAVLSQALYRARSTASDPAAFDRAIIAALRAAPTGELSYRELGELLLASVPSSSALRDELSRRGVLGCLRVLRGDGPFRAPGGYVAPGTRTTGTNGAAPPVMQFARAIEERTRAVTIALRSKASLRAFARMRAPIVYDVLGGHVTDGEPVREIALTRDGEWLRGTLTLDGDPGGDLHVAIESENESDARYDEVTITPGPRTQPEEGSGGCSCATAGARSSGPLVVLLAPLLATLLWRRRVVA